MSQLTMQAPPAITDGIATVTSSSPGSPGSHGRLRIWARVRQAFQDMTYTPDYPSELHIRWP
jgi:hypothetical protein